jgi:hypothetical protein
MITAPARHPMASSAQTPNIVALTGRCDALTISGINTYTTDAASIAAQISFICFNADSISLSAGTLTRLCSGE